VNTLKVNARLPQNCNTVIVVACENDDTTNNTTGRGGEWEDGECVVVYGTLCLWYRSTFDNYRLL